ncbi:MAG TPA: diaminopimelate epimerase [Kiritimatiellia bacterium]|nr:diaminopimelate epimerase [Kiritimatiellia bacterium]
MTPNLTFSKMHGAGNDFVVADDRSLTFPAENKAWIASLCSRRTGVGADGLLLVQPSDTADFRMRYFNADGGEVDMCGNGARCIARFAHDHGAAPGNMSFETMAGLIRAEIVGERVRLAMTEPHDWRLDRDLVWQGETLAYDFVNTGVEHVVLRRDTIASVDLVPLGRGLRYHEAFQPRGTNVNVIEVTGPRDLAIRTYERGVEDETLACGTGMVASALIAARKGWVEASPVRLTCASGDVLEVGFTLTENGAAEVTLFGPAVYVFSGALPFSSPLT